MQIERVFLEEEPRVYADVAKAGGILYLSGIVSCDPVTGEIADGDITLQTRNCLLGLKQLLEDNGSDMEHVLRVEVLLTDFTERDEMNREYIRHFAQDKLPARLCYGVSGLADDLKIEIMATAVEKE